MSAILEQQFNIKTFILTDHKEIDNSVHDDTIFENLHKLHELLLHIRNKLSDHYARPIQIKINRAYSCPEINKLVGGVLTSQHPKGEAADTFAIGLTLDEYFDQVKSLVKENIIKVGQVIAERRFDGKGRLTNQWLHVSLPNEKHTNEFLATNDGKNYTHV